MKSENSFSDLDIPVGGPSTCLAAAQATTRRGPPPEVIARAESGEALFRSPIVARHLSTRLGTSSGRPPARARNRRRQELERSAGRHQGSGTARGPGDAEEGP